MIILYSSKYIYIYINIYIYIPYAFICPLLAPKKSPWTQHQPIPFRQVCSGLRKPLIFEEIADQEVIDCPGLSPRRCGTGGTGGACCLDGLVKGLGTRQKDPKWSVVVKLNYGFKLKRRPRRSVFNAKKEVGFETNQWHKILGWHQAIQTKWMFNTKTWPIRDVDRSIAIILRWLGWPCQIPHEKRLSSKNVRFSGSKKIVGPGGMPSPTMSMEHCEPILPFTSLCTSPLWNGWTHVPFQTTFLKLKEPFCKDFCPVNPAIL